MEAVLQVPINPVLWRHGQYRTMHIAAVIGRIIDQSNRIIVRYLQQLWLVARAVAM